MIHHKSSKHNKDNFSSSMKQQHGREHRHLQVWLTFGQCQKFSKLRHTCARAHTRMHTPHAHTHTQCMHQGRLLCKHQGGELPQNLLFALLGVSAQESFRKWTVTDVKNPRTVPLTWSKCPWCFKCHHKKGLAAAHQEPCSLPP